MKNMERQKKNNALTEQQKHDMKLQRIMFLSANVPLIVGLIYMMLYWTTGFHIELSPCVFLKVLHLYCPGCGGTRAVYAMARLDVIRSFCCHPMVPYVAAIYTYYYIGAIITIVKNNGKVYYHLHLWMLYVAVAIMVVQWIFKNLLAVIWHVDYLGDIAGYWL